MVVCLEPLRGVLLSLLDGFDDVLAEPCVPDGVNAALDVSVLRELVGLDVLDGYARFIGPYQQLATDVLPAVVPLIVPGCGSLVLLVAKSRPRCPALLG